MSVVPTPRLCSLDSFLTTRPLLLPPCFQVKYVEPHVMAFLQPCGATVMGFVWIHLLLLFIGEWRLQGLEEAKP